MSGSIFNPTPRASGQAYASADPRHRVPRIEGPSVRDGGIIAAVLVVVTIIGVAIDREVDLHPATAAWLYLLVVLPVTLRWNLRVGLAAALLAGILVYWLFVDPRYTLYVRDLADLIRLPLIAGGMVASVLVVDQANRARRTAEIRLIGQAERERAQRVREESLSAIAHDLRTPLTVIKAGAQLLQRQASGTRPGSARSLAEGLAEIEQAATKMAVMLEDVLDAAREEAGRPLVLHRRPTDLVALARHEAAEVAATAPGRTIRVEAAAAKLVGEWDPTRIARVLDNLLTNAVKYSPAVSPVRVDVSWQDDCGPCRAVVVVRDEGLGIPAADLPYLFERFHRGMNVAGRIPGNGLGLVSARHIVEQHGGTIAVESQEGAGTTVTVRLPLG